MNSGFSISKLWGGGSFISPEFWTIPLAQSQNVISDFSISMRGFFWGEGEFYLFIYCMVVCMERLDCLIMALNY